MAHGASARFASRVSATCIVHRCITHCTLRVAHGTWRMRILAFCFARPRTQQRAALHWCIAHQRRAPASSIGAAHQASALRAAQVTHRASLVAERLVLRINASRVSASRIKAPCAAHCASHATSCIGIVRCRARAVLLASCIPAWGSGNSYSDCETERALRRSVVTASATASATAPAPSSRQQLRISASAIVIAGVCG